MVITTDAAIKAPQLICAYDTKLKIAKGKVFVRPPLSTIENTKLFHENTNERSIAVIIPGLARGSMIFQNVVTV